MGARLAGWNLTQAAATGLHGGHQVGQGGTGQAVGGWGGLSLFRSAEMPGPGAAASASVALASTGLLSDDDRIAAGVLSLLIYPG